MSQSRSSKHKDFANHLWNLTREVLQGSLGQPMTRTAVAALRELVRTEIQQECMHNNYSVDAGLLAAELILALTSVETANGEVVKLGDAPR